MRLKINEIFGPTIQGEGPYAGQHCVFIRLAECNLTCNFCDTPQTWAFTPTKAAKHHTGRVYSRDENVREMCPAEILAEIDTFWPVDVPTIIVISGGEPLLQCRALIPLVQLVQHYGHRVHVETAGTILPPPELIQLLEAIVISPKLHNSGNEERFRERPQVLDALAECNNSWWKFVAGNVDDLHEAEALVDRYRIDPDRVFIMPEGITAETVLKTASAIVEEVIDRGFGLSLRTHVLLWGNERGR